MDTIPLLNISVWLIVKIFILVILFLYSVFAVVIIKQVTMMSKTFKSGLNALIHFLSVAHLLFAVFIFILALIIL
jgi:hypothetical protein